MMKLVHQILYAGIGLAAMTEQKAKDLVDELVKNGEVSSEEGKKLVQEIIDKAKHHSQELRKTVTEEVEKTGRKLGWVPRKDYEELLKRVEELEQKLP